MRACARVLRPGEECPGKRRQAVLLRRPRDVLHLHENPQPNRTRGLPGLRTPDLHLPAAEASDRPPVLAEPPSQVLLVRPIAEDRARARTYRTPTVNPVVVAGGGLSGLAAGVSLSRQKVP